MSNSRQNAMSKLPKVAGGEPITEEMSINLRRIALGDEVNTFSTGFRRQYFQFYPEKSEFPFGLVVQKYNGCRGLAMCIEAYVLKHLLFQMDTKSHIEIKSMLKATCLEREMALISGLTDILWKAGADKKAYICLPQHENCFDVQNSNFLADGITEMLHIYSFEDMSSLNSFIRRNFDDYFINEKCSGFMIFLYSLILSRTIPKLKDDLHGHSMQLLMDSEECSASLINLLITGQAVPFFHNGDICYDIEGNYLTVPLKGTQARSQIGYLHHDKKEDISNRTEVGSMLKTPRWPIWVGFLNGHYVLLFSVNPTLISDWRSENKFPLHYYTGLSSQQKDTELLIETRVGRAVKKKENEQGTRIRDESRIPPVESLILTKWQGACVDWNGEDPYF